MDKVLVRNALQGMIRATDDDSTPIIRRLARIQARAALANLDAEAASGAGEREGSYVAGPIWAEPEDDCFTAEIQTVGGHEVIATVHGGTRDEAECRQAAVLRSLASLPPATDPAMVERRQLAEGLARYMDTKAFVAKKVGKEQAERLKVRRSIAIDRARAAIRFFEKPENFARLEARIDRAAAPTIPATGDKRNAHDDAAVYGIGVEVDGVAIHPGRVVIRKRQAPATGHAATEKTLSDVLDEARKSLRITDGCMECNANDVQRWHDTIAWLESLA